MSTLKRVLDAELKDLRDSHQIMVAVICHEMRKQGDPLSASHRGRLEQELQLANLGEKSPNAKQYAENDSALDLSKATEISGGNPVAAAKACLEAALPEITTAKSEAFFDSLMQSVSSILKDEHEEQRQLEEDIRQEWGKPLDRLNMLIALAKEARADFDSEFCMDAVRSGDYKFLAITALHARACQVSSEILVLLRCGFADGAHARWRTLQEILAVTLFIEKNDQELALRYLFHEPIQRYKLALKFQQESNLARARRVPQEWMDYLEALQGHLIEGFGQDFKGNYGWAASVISGNPNLHRIAEYAGLDDFSPDYGIASSNVHANAHGAYHRLGLGVTPGDELLSGPSILGLAYPGYQTAISLRKVTTALLHTRSDLDGAVTVRCAVILKTLPRIVYGIVDAFVEVGRELESFAEAQAKPEDRNNGQTGDA